MKDEKRGRGRGLIGWFFTDIEKLLTIILAKVNEMAQTMADLERDLKTVTEQVTKIGVETAATLDTVKALEEALAAGGVTTPEVDAAMAELKAQAQKTDDMVPDAQPDPSTSRSR